MKHDEYKKKREAKKNRQRDNRFNHFYGMGIRLSHLAAVDVPYRRVRSAKRFIKLVDGVECLTFLYETFGYSGYGCKKVECLHKHEETLLERYGENLCWK